MKDSQEPVQPITLHQVNEEIKRRITLITEEFTKGFEFIKKQPKSVSVFGSSRLLSSHPFYKQAEELGRLLAKKGYSIITGGGPGIMEGANKGAFEAHGRSVGLNIHLPYEQQLNKYVNHEMTFHYFFSRKVMLTFSAEAYIFFPGGFGTLDEFFEILTLVQTKKIETVPIILFGSAYWNKIITFMSDEMIKLGAIDAEDIHLITITDDIHEIAKIVENVPVRNGVRLREQAIETQEQIKEHIQQKEAGR